MFIGVVVVLGCMGTGDDLVSQPFDGTQYAGRYDGSWNNATYSTTGASWLEVTAVGATKTGTARWDLDGNVLGTNNPPAEQYDGTWNDNGFTFSGTSAVFGDFTLSLNRNGTATGSANNVPNAAIDHVTFSGTASPQAVNITYTVFFTAAGGGGTATGTVSMTKS